MFSIYFALQLIFNYNVCHITLLPFLLKSLFPDPWWPFLTCLCPSLQLGAMGSPRTAPAAQGQARIGEGDRNQDPRLTQMPRWSVCITGKLRNTFCS